MRAARKALRRAIRVENARQRKQIYTDLMKTDANKDVIFYQLVAKQRKTKRQTSHALRVNGNIVNDNKGLLQAWASHFCKLGTQAPNPNYDQCHYERITKTKKCISTYIDAFKPFQNAPPITITEVEKSIGKLNNGKAADKRGLTAEHLKQALPHIASPLATMFTAALHQGIQPDSFTTGSLTPVGKKGKDILDPNNNRGIVISPILAKVYEHIIDLREADDDSTDPLQFGFTEGRSPTMASLLTTEAIAESIDEGQPVYIASLDSQKAFDVVWQDSLSVRLFIKKPPEYWQAHTKLLEDTQLQVKINGEYSEPFRVNQGVGQGKILSTKNYKDYIEPVLGNCRRCQAGCYTGIFYVATPTCADDVLLIARSMEDLQTLMSIAYEFSKQERFNIHPQKTKIIVYNFKGPDNLHVWKLGETEVRPSSFLTHLGINRYASSITSDDIIQERITSARKTAFSPYNLETDIFPTNSHKATLTCGYLPNVYSLNNPNLTCL